MFCDEAMDGEMGTSVPTFGIGFKKRKDEISV